MTLDHDPPRRWSEVLEGYVWLPRLIDKARATLAGQTGAYELGTPTDRQLLDHLGLRPREVLDLVARTADDAEAARLLVERKAEAPEARTAWNRAFLRRNRAILLVLDFDDGYLRPPLLAVPVVAIGNALQAVLIGFRRRARARKETA